MPLPVLPAPLPQRCSLLSSQLPGQTWTPSNVKCLHEFHLFSYGNLVHWDPKSRSWASRVLIGYLILHLARDPLNLPQMSAVSLFQAKPGTLRGLSFLPSRIHGHRNPECKHDGIPVRPGPYGAVPPLVLANPFPLFRAVRHPPIYLIRPGIHRLRGSGFVVPGDLRSCGHVLKITFSYTHHLRKHFLAGRSVSLSPESSHSPVHRQILSLDALPPPLLSRDS